MCEHNFKFGEIYEVSALGTCDTCSTPFRVEFLCKYSGDLNGFHKLEVLQPRKCTGCDLWLDNLNIVCGDNPLQVTQEFLSLPVRSRE